MSKYREAFAKRIATAGLKPHPRIGLSHHTLLYSFSVVVSVLSRLSPHCAASVACPL
ncbi:hypothetical protein CsSME_00027234 [Camellia sinensis var. sinensis]